MKTAADLLVRRGGKPLLVSVTTRLKSRGTSSGFAKELSATLAKFYWQGGYGAFSVSQSNLEEVVRYIENQEKHHKRVTFQDEYRAFLKAYAIEYDERYVWD